jgi:diguanylate cyclase (GGDEF)-like protein
VNPAFEPTAVMGHAPVPDGTPGRVSPRFTQAAALALAAAALPLTAWPSFFASGGWPLQESALACALVSAGLLRWSAGAQRRDAAARGLVDPGTGLYNRRGLVEAGEALLRQARHEKRAVSLVVFDFEDLAEVRTIYGPETARKLLARVVRRIEMIASGRGLAARTGKAQFTVLLSGATRERAQAIVQRVLGKPSRVEFDAGDSEIVLVPDIGLEMAAADVETVDELFREVAHNIAEARALEQRRQHYLQRERERHSRPMSLPPSLHSR